MPETDPLIKQATAWRRRQELSQRQVAEMAGVRQARISTVESGRHSPSLHTFRRYLQAIGLDLQIVVLPAERQ